MSKYLFALLLLSLYGCGIHDEGKNLIVKEIKYDPLLTVGTINNVIYSDTADMDYLTYSVFKSKYKDGYLYQRFITLNTNSVSQDISLYIESEEECGTKLSSINKDTINGVTRNRLQYHITCIPNVVIVEDNGKKYHYSW